MKIIAPVLSLFLLVSPTQLHAEKHAPHMGIWITVFTPENIFYSKKSADELIKNCKKTGIDHIYLQIYRAGKAYYDSNIADRSSFDEIKESFGEDPIKYIAAQAGNNGIKIYAWINVLSVAQNEDASVIRKVGVSAVTLDQNEQPSLVKPEDKNIKASKEFLREDQLFLEPGNREVQDYLVRISHEIMAKYPGFSGLHLDYIRYPAAIPFVPGARFDSHGISYGYTYRNMLNFKKATGLEVKKMDGSRKNFQKWDDWRRGNVTTLVTKISRKIRAYSPGAELSCAVVPSPERAYTINFQDWTKWLKDSLVDYVVLMNYTDDNELLALRTLSSYSEHLREKIYVGIGAYLLKEDVNAIEEQIEIIDSLSPGGIVIFSYDEIAENQELQLFLSKR